MRISDESLAIYRLLEPVISWSGRDIKLNDDDETVFLSRLNNGSLLRAALDWADSIDYGSGDTYDDDLMIGLIFSILEFSRVADFVSIKAAGDAFRSRISIGIAGFAVTLTLGLWAMEEDWLLLGAIGVVVAAWSALVTIGTLVQMLTYRRRFRNQTCPLHFQLSKIIQEVRSKAFDEESLRAKFKAMEQDGGEVSSIVYRLLEVRERYRKRGDIVTT